MLLNILSKNLQYKILKKKKALSQQMPLELLGSFSNLRRWDQTLGLQKCRYKKVSLQSVLTKKVLRPSIWFNMTLFGGKVGLHTNPTKPHPKCKARWRDQHTGKIVSRFYLGVYEKPKKKAKPECFWMIKSRLNSDPLAQLRYCCWTWRRLLY